MAGTRMYVCPGCRHWRTEQQFPGGIGLCVLCNGSRKAW